MKQHQLALADESDEDSYNNLTIDDILNRNIDESSSDDDHHHSTPPNNTQTVGSLKLEPDQSLNHLQPTTHNHSFDFGRRMRTTTTTGGGSSLFGGGVLLKGTPAKPGAALAAAAAASRLRPPRRGGLIHATLSSSLNILKLEPSSVLEVEGLVSSHNVDVESNGVGEVSTRFKSGLSEKESIFKSSIVLDESILSVEEETNNNEKISILMSPGRFEESKSKVQEETYQGILVEIVKEKSHSRNDEGLVNVSNELDEFNLTNQVSDDREKGCLNDGNEESLVIQSNGSRLSSEDLDLRDRASLNEVGDSLNVVNSEDGVLGKTQDLDSRERTSFNEVGSSSNVGYSEDEDFGTSEVVIGNVEGKSEGVKMENGKVTDDADGVDSDIIDVVEERLLQLENERESKKMLEKKSRAMMKPLEVAEELEKNYASNGLNWEEGVAAQPMKLEGIRRGPPAVGYLQIDPNNEITRLISTQAFRNSHGSAQVVAVHANFIAVGTLKGLVLVMPSVYNAHNVDSMDSKTVLMFRSQGDRSQSPVTSMCFNQHGDMLLVGYGDGNLKLWDVQKAVMTKMINGEHKGPVVHTIFVGQDPKNTRQFKAITTDCKGTIAIHTFSVNTFSFNPVSVTSEAIPAVGTILSISPLLNDSFGGSYTSTKGSATGSSRGISSLVGGIVGGETGWKLFSEGSPMVEEGVVILVNRQTALVVRFNPKFQKIVHLSKPDGVREGSIPYTAWKCISSSPVSANEKGLEETYEKASLLVIAWDRKVQVAKLVKSDLKVVKVWTLDSAAIGVAWLDDQMLLVLTVRGQLCLFSKEGNEIHRTSFSVDGSGADDFIAYHTYFNNKFGNPEKAYHNCVAVRGATIYLLGPMQLVVSRLLPWKERIQVLRKAGDWMGALEMTMRLYDGQAHGVIDLPRTLDSIREVIMPYLVDLILSYVDEVFSYISVAFCNQLERDEQANDSKGRYRNVHSEMEDQFARVGGVAVEFCVHIKRIDILFDDIFSKFVAVQHGGTFLELLEPYILKDMLGCLPPEIMQALVEHYNSKGWLQRVEQCVLHMDISSLDFNQVVRLCREHGLYGALIYLFNKGLDDFKAPLEELLPLVRESQSKNSAAIGYRILVYLKYCFSGLAFPPGHGTLPRTRLPSLRAELLQFLLEESVSIESQENFNSPTEASPNMYHLLRLDTEATLEVLNCAFLEEEMYKSDVSQDNNDMTKENHNFLVQNTVNVLIHILGTDIPEAETLSGAILNGSLEIWPSRKDMGHIFEFVSYFVARKTVTISRTILNQILEYLTLEDTSLLPFQIDGVSKGREKQVLRLLRVVPDTDWDTSHVLHICEKAKFYQVCGLIYSKGRQYVAALDSYTKDFCEPVHAFSFINSMLLQLTDAEFATFQLEVISRIPELICLCREAAFFLIIDHLYPESEHILSDLRSHRKSMFMYLKTVIEVHLSGKLDFSSLEKDCSLDSNSRRGNNEQSVECKAYLKRISDFPKLLRDNPVLVTDEMVELYLELLCQFERSSVLKFLESFENYRVEHCLRLCQEYGVIDAAAFLLERVGDVGSALLLTLSSLNEKLVILETAVESMVSDAYFRRLSEIEQLNSVSKLTEVNVICDILHMSIGLCQRNTKRLDHEESESLWFRLLDSFCDPFRVLNSVSGKNCGSTLEAALREVKNHILKKMFSQFIKEIVEGMIGYVRLPIIMTKLLSDNGNQEFGDFKLTILGILGTYGFERRILDNAKSLIEEDTYYTMNLLKKGATHGYALQNLLCCVCNCFLTKESSVSGIRVFTCGHATHIKCELSQGEVLSNRGSSGCPVCTPKKKAARVKNKSVIAEEGLVKNHLSKSKQIQGTNTVQYPYESDPTEKQHGLQQISRFEILNNLQNSQKSTHIEKLPQLRLAPPAVYHEKVKKRSYVSPGESSSSSSGTMKNEKATISKQLKEFKIKGSSLRSFGMFGKETKTRKP